MDVIARRHALHAALLASDSATAVLERNFGAPVHVRRTAPDIVDADSAGAVLLKASGTEIVTCRRVQLHRGGAILSDAKLCYVATRLPAEMARDLAHTAEPFGRVVRSLGLRRTRLSARLCAPGEACALEHRALLTTADGRPMALVDERYPWTLFSS